MKLAAILSLILASSAVAPVVIYYDCYGRVTSYSNRCYTGEGGPIGGGGSYKLLSLAKPILSTIPIPVDNMDGKEKGHDNMDDKNHDEDHKTHHHKNGHHKNGHHKNGHHKNGHEKKGHEDDNAD